jgi:hypothetical protein
MKTLIWILVAAAALPVTSPKMDEAETKRFIIDQYYKSIDTEPRSEFPLHTFVGVMRETMEDNGVGLKGLELITYPKNDEESKTYRVYLADYKTETALLSYFRELSPGKPRNDIYAPIGVIGLEGSLLNRRVLVVKKFEFLQQAPTNKPPMDKPNYEDGPH